MGEALLGLAPSPATDLVDVITDFHTNPTVGADGSAHPGTPPGKRRHWTPDDVDAMVARLVAGETSAQVAVDYRVSSARVRQLTAGRVARQPATRHRFECVQITQRYIGGATLGELANEYSVSTERIRQVIAQTEPDYREMRAAAKAARRTSQTTPRTTSKADPKPEAREWPGHGRSREQIVDDIRWAAERCRDRVPVFNNTAYDKVRRQHPKRPALPSAQVVRVFGDWKTACAEAGVQTGDPATGRRPHANRRWTRADALHAVARWLAEPGHDGSYRAFGEWAQRDPRSPSRATVITILHRQSWDSIKTEAAKLDPTRKAS